MPAKLIAILLLAAVSGWIASGQMADAPKKDTAENDVVVPLTTVRTKQSIGAENTRFVTLYGVTAPARRVDVKAEVEGKVTEIVAKEGSLVQANDIILTIEERDRKAKLDEAQALVEQFEIEYNTAKQLSSQGLQSKNRAAQAKAELEQARAVLIQAKISYDNTKIRAPFSGFLEKINVEVGSLVGPNIRTGEGSFNDGDTIVSLIERDPFLVVAQVSETDIKSIHVGLEADVKLITGQRKTGIVTFVGRIADANTRTFRVEMEIPNAEGDVQSGITTSITLPLEKRLTHLIPTSALTLNKEGKLGIKFVDSTYIRDDGKRVGITKFTPVTIFDYTERDILASNLPQEIELITTGHAFVQAGQDVILVAEQ